jgi:diguanylate cyclase (GGDEF)-like protein
VTNIKKEDVPKAPAALFYSGNPRSLLNLFLLLSVLSVAVILSLVGYGIHRIYGGQMILDAGEDSFAVGQAILQQERGTLIAKDAGGRERIAVARPEFEGLDARMRGFLHPFHIYKIKVYSEDKTIVYSTDPSIVGVVDDNNSKLARTLTSGEIISFLVKKDKVLDLADEQRFDVGVVETYLPIRAGDAIVGAFEVYVDVTGTQKRIARVVVSSISVLFAVLVTVFASLFLVMRKGALLLERAEEGLRDMAHIDALTGLFNRGFMDTRVHEEYSRKRRERSKGVTTNTTGIIMADLDHFKRINDEYGHPVGDEVLRSVSEKLRTATRVYDILGRYGGEEFLITLPNTDLEGTKVVAERIRSEIERSPIVVEGRTIRMTVSVGAACSANDEDDETVAIERADKALYKAKNEGRNRVAWI